MQRSMFVLFALCGLLWPAESVAQDPVRTPATDPNLRLRAFYGYDISRVSVIVDWSTMYAKPEEESPLETGEPAVRYSFYLYDRVAEQQVEIISSSIGQILGSTSVVYEGENVHVRLSRLQKVR